MKAGKKLFIISPTFAILLLILINALTILYFNSQIRAVHEESQYSISSIKEEALKTFEQEKQRADNFRAAFQLMEEKIAKASRLEWRRVGRFHRQEGLSTEAYNEISDLFFKGSSFKLIIYHNEFEMVLPVFRVLKYAEHLIMFVQREGENGKHNTMGITISKDEENGRVHLGNQEIIPKTVNSFFLDYESNVMKFTTISYTLLVQEAFEWLGDFTAGKSCPDHIFEKISNGVQTGKSFKISFAGQSQYLAERVLTTHPQNGQRNIFFYATKYGGKVTFGLRLSMDSSNGEFFVGPAIPISADQNNAASILNKFIGGTSAEYSYGKMNFGLYMSL